MSAADLNWFGNPNKNNSILEPEDYENLAMDLRAAGATDEEVAKIIDEYETSSIRMNILSLMRKGFVEIADLENGEPRFQATQAGLEFVKNLSDDEE